MARAILARGWTASKRVSLTLSGCGKANSSWVENLRCAASRPPLLIIHDAGRYLFRIFASPLCPISAHQSSQTVLQTLTCSQPRDGEGGWGWGSFIMFGGLEVDIFNQFWLTLGPKIDLQKFKKLKFYDWFFFFTFKAIFFRQNTIIFFLYIKW